MEHTGEALGDALEHLHDGGGRAQEGDGHLQTEASHIVGITIPVPLKNQE